MEKLRRRPPSSSTSRYCPAPEMKRLDGRQPQEHLHHIGRKAIQARDPARQSFDLRLRRVDDDARLDLQIRTRARLTQQHVALCGFLCREPCRSAVWIVNFARDQSRLARCTVP